jgi:hypothetical protein
MKRPPLNSYGMRGGEKERRREWGYKTARQREYKSIRE